MPSKMMLMTISYTLLTLIVINNVKQLKPVRQVISGESGFFG